MCRGQWQLNDSLTSVCFGIIIQTLARSGDIHLSTRALGMMVGEIFAIQHDVNLHSEILDTPDFFSNEEKKRMCTLFLFY